MIPNEPVLYKNIITEKERILLKNHAIDLLDKGLLNVNTTTHGQYRNYAQYFDIRSLLPAHKLIYDRVIKILELKNPIIDPALGLIISVIKPGGYIHAHKDEYINFSNTKHLSNMRNIRFNIMVERGNDISYNPEIDNKMFTVELRDAWCFAASELEHKTLSILGPENRIVYQFGFMLDAI